MLEDLFKKKLDGFLSELPDDIKTQIDNEELKNLVKSKLNQILKRKNSKYNQLFTTLTTLQLYRDLEFMRKFNKGKNICDNDEKNTKMILNIYNTCIIPKFGGIVEFMRLDNYHHVINDIMFLINNDLHDEDLIKKIVGIHKNIKESDKLISFNIIQFTKHLICIIRDCLPSVNREEKEDYDREEEKEEEEEERDENLSSASEPLDNDYDDDEEELEYEDEELVEKFREMMKNREVVIGEKEQNERIQMKEEEKLTRKIMKEKKKAIN